MDEKALRIDALKTAIEITKVYAGSGNKLSGYPVEKELQNVYDKLVELRTEIEKL